MDWLLVGLPLTHLPLVLYPTTGLDLDRDLLRSSLQKHWVDLDLLTSLRVSWRLTIRLALASLESVLLMGALAVHVLLLDLGCLCFVFVGQYVIQVSELVVTHMLIFRLVTIGLGLRLR